MSVPHRFFVVPQAIDGDRATLEGDQAHQIADVLRLGAGDRIVLVCDGEELEVDLDRVARTRVEGTVTARHQSAAEPRVRLTLALPLLRGDRSEEVIEGAAQLGVSRIVPFTSERSVVRDLSPAKRTRWERIAREAAETARRGRVPAIGPLVPWSELLDQLDPPVVVCWEEEKERTLREALADRTEALSLVIGPEGGLSFEEVSFARSVGCMTASLGPRNLRSEIAAAAAVASAFALLDG